MLLSTLLLVGCAAEQKVAATVPAAASSLEQDLATGMADADLSDVDQLNQQIDDVSFDDLDDLTLE